MEINDQYKDQDGTQCWKENKCNLPMDLTWAVAMYSCAVGSLVVHIRHATFYSIVHWPGLTGLTSQQKTNGFLH